MTTIAEALIEVRADMSRVASDVDRGGATVGKSGSKIGSALGKGIALGAGAILAGGAFLKGAFDEAQEAAKVGAITANAIKATGGAAGVTAEQVGDMAGRLSAVSGIDDEAIQSGANLLLTFKNVKNYVDGEFVGTFDRANAAAVDLSAAGFGSIEGGAKMLGKALNDPVAGISALSKAGVTFSEEQKTMIGRFVETGRAAEAQNLILSEVESQVGGAGAAQATAADKASVAWGNLKETIGTALMPMLSKVFTFISTTGIPAVLSLGDTLGKAGAYISPVAGYVRGLFASFSGGSGQLGALKTTFMSVFESVKSTVRDAVSIVKTLWANFGSTILTTARTVFGSMLTIIRGAWKIIAGIFKVFSSLLKGDWQGVWSGIKSILSGAWAVIKGIVRGGWAVIKALFSAAGTVLKGIFTRLWDGIKSVAAKAWDGLVNLVQNGADRVVDFVKSIPGKITNLAGAFLSAGKELGGKVIGGIGDGLRSAGGFISDIGASVKSAINGALNLPVTIKGPGPLPDFTIPAFAKGTNYAPGGLALVGEQGPELVNLPRGSKVATAARTRALAGRAVAAAGVGVAAAGVGLLTITNWDEGTGYFRVVAGDVLADGADFSDTLGRMGR